MIKLPSWAAGDFCCFTDQRFVSLKDLINKFGGNLQPVKVRPMSGTQLHHGWAALNEKAGYELVFGFARVRACLELGLPVLAMVEQMSEVEALRQFFFESRSDGIWRPWRLGGTLEATLDSGCFPNLRRASQVLGLSVTEAALMQQMGRVPAAIRMAFGELELTPRQAKKLVDAMTTDPHKLLANASQIEGCKRLSASAVLAQLMEAGK